MHDGRVGLHEVSAFSCSMTAKEDREERGCETSGRTPDFTDHFEALEMLQGLTFFCRKGILLLRLCLLQLGLVEAGHL